MGVYINMEMPKEGFVEILIRDDGTVQQTGKSYRIDGTDYYTPYVGEMPTIYKAVPVPPHGDLIDRDAAAEKIWDDMRFPSNLANAQFFVNELREMPTFIPAELPKEET